jgi:dipeptidyl aminopeptidase/acylaminoacyl peptidase
VPAIIEELHLPQTDLFGNRLVYLLRDAGNGTVLSGDRSLEAAGVSGGAKLALDSYVLDGSVATLMRDQDAAPGFHAADTLADAAALPTLPAPSARDLHTSAALPVVNRHRKRRWTRRAFLLLGGTVLGVGTAGLGYAAYQQYIAGKVTPANIGMAQTRPTQKKASPAPQPVPTGAQATLVFAQHTQPVRSVTWSPGGKRLASGANDAQLLVWDTGGAVLVQVAQPGQVRAVAWSPDGALLAAGAMNRVTWLNAQTGAQLAQSQQVHTGTITTLAWSPQSPYRLVSGATDTKAVVWDARFTPQTAFLGHTAPVESASWALDNQTVATSSHGGVVRVWMASNGQEIHPLYIDAQRPMRALAFNPATNQLAVGGDDGIVRVWSGLTCQQAGQGQFGAQCLDMPMRITAHNSVVRALAWSPDGRFLATGGDDGMLALWYPAQGLAPLFKVHHTDPVPALAWSPDGKQIAAASGNSVTVWALMN